MSESRERLRAVIDAFREGGGARKPVRVLVRVAWAPTDEEALGAAFEQWRTNLAAPALLADLDRVEHFELAAMHVRPDDLRSRVLISSDPARHAQWLHDLIELGADELLVHQVGSDQPRFIETYGEHVLPELTR